MRLVEYEAKALLRDAGLPVPPSRIWSDISSNAEEPAASPQRLVAKAQVLQGGRGKMGLIGIADAGRIEEEVARVRSRMAAHGMDPLVMVEDEVAADAEYYLAWRIDDILQAPVLMFSAQGGVDIEDHPESMRELAVDRLVPCIPAGLVTFLRDAGAMPRHVGAIARFASAAYRLFLAEDLELLEINPLGAIGGAVVALDAKISVDENALVRHRRWTDSISAQLELAALPDLERRAKGRGLTFLDLTGNIALFSSGAGLGMALLDMISDAGLEAANFVDASGGSGGDVFTAIGELVFERAARPDVDAILMFFALSGTSLKTVVDTLLRTLDANPPPKPLVIGIVAGGASEREMTAAEARAAFTKRGYHTVSELDEAIQAVKTLVAGRRGVTVNA